MLVALPKHGSQNMSTADEIAKLAALRDAGELTQEQFEAAKAEVLAAPDAAETPQPPSPKSATTTPTSAPIRKRKVSRRGGCLTVFLFAALAIVLIVLATRGSSGPSGPPSHIVVVQGNSTTGGGSWCYTDPTNAHLIFMVTLQNTGAGAGTVQIEPWRRFNDGSTNDGTGDLTNNLTIPAHSTKRYQATVSYNPLTKAPIECRVYLGPNFTYQQDIRVLR